MCLRILVAMVVLSTMSDTGLAQTAELIHTTDWSKKGRTQLDPLNTLTVSSPVHETALIVSGSQSLGQLTELSYRVRFDYNERRQDERYDYQIQEFSVSAFAFDNWLFNLGKTQIGWDMASSFQPLGFFQPTQNLFDLTDIQSRFSGLPLASATYLQDNWSATFVYSNDYWSSYDHFNRGVEQWASRLQVMTSSVELAIVAQKPAGQKPGIGASVVASPSEHSVAYLSAFYRQGTRRLQNEQIRAGELTFAIDPPFAASLKQANQPFWRAVIGLSLALPGVDISVEVSHDERGLDTAQWRNLTDLINFHRDVMTTSSNPDMVQLAGLNMFYNSQSLETTGSQKSYAFLNCQTDFFDGRIAFFSRVSLQDKSGVYGITFNRQLGSGLTLLASAQAFVGQDNDEFGLTPLDHSMQVTLRYVFN